MRSSATLTSSSRAAASRNTLLTSAQARRIAMPPISIDWLPAVYHSSGDCLVSPATSDSRSRLTSSSSAAICAMAVSMPCPSSTLPLNTVTVRSALNRTQRSRRGVVLRLCGSTGDIMPRAGSASRALPRGSHAESGRGCRSGKDFDPARRRSARRSDRTRAGAARPPR